jgi:hypothetical protein
MWGGAPPGRFASGSIQDWLGPWRCPLACGLQEGGTASTRGRGDDVYGNLSQQSRGGPCRQRNALVNARRRTTGLPVSNRARVGQRNLELPFIPPEDWHEPRESGGAYRVLVQDPGPGFRHVVTPGEVRARLAQLPERFLKPLEVVQFSRMTRKKKSFPCYGMQWGAALYLYPIETSLIEQYARPPKPNQRTEALMYGGRWECDDRGWRLVWTPEAIRDFYLNNILLHELGHLLDARNSRAIDRERFAEWFAIEFGYKPSRRTQREVVRRHHKVA